MAGELTSLSLAMGRGVVSGGVVPVPTPPAGFSLLKGADGAYLKGADGAYLYGKAS